MLDLITGYPSETEAFIGWFMVDVSKQGQGIGSDIFADVRAAMTAQGFTQLTMNVPKVNEEAIKFWRSQGFAEAGETTSPDGLAALVMQRTL